MSHPTVPTPSRLPLMDEDDTRPIEAIIRTAAERLVRRHIPLPMSPEDAARVAKGESAQGRTGLVYIGEQLFNTSSLLLALAHLSPNRYHVAVTNLWTEENSTDKPATNIWATLLDQELQVYLRLSQLNISIVMLCSTLHRTRQLGETETVREMCALLAHLGVEGITPDHPDLVELRTLIRNLRHKQFGDIAPNA